MVLKHLRFVEGDIVFVSQKASISADRQRERFGTVVMGASINPTPSEPLQLALFGEYSKRNVLCSS